MQGAVEWLMGQDVFYCEHFLCLMRHSVCEERIRSGICRCDKTSQLRLDWASQLWGSNAGAHRSIPDDVDIIQVGDPI